MTHPIQTVLFAALTLGLASAQAQTTPPPAPVSLPGTLPASVSRTQTDAVKAFLAAGGQVQLVNAAGAVIGTLNPDGTVTLVAGATLSDARTVQVTPPAGQGQATSFPLARDLGKPGAIKFEVAGPGGQTLSLPLSALVNRQAARADTGRGGSAEREKPEQPEKPEKPEKPDKPGKGKGK